MSVSSAAQPCLRVCVLQTRLRGRSVELEAGQPGPDHQQPVDVAHVLHTARTLLGCGGVAEHVQDGLLQAEVEACPVQGAKPGHVSEAGHRSE